MCVCVCLCVCLRVYVCVCLRVREAKMTWRTLQCFREIEKNPARYFISYGDITYKSDPIAHTCTYLHATFLSDPLEVTHLAKIPENDASTISSIITFGGQMLTWIYLLEKKNLYSESKEKLCSYPCIYL